MEKLQIISCWRLEAESLSLDSEWSLTLAWNHVLNPWEGIPVLMPDRWLLKCLSICPREKAKELSVDYFAWNLEKEIEMIRAVFFSVIVGFLLMTSPASAAEVSPGMVCSAIVDRACDGIASTFPANVGKLYAHTRIVGMEGGGSITHRWVYKGKVMAEPSLNIGGPDWRTWSSKNIDQFWSGDWKVEIVDNSDGSVMDILEFVIQE
jgi:hypothetical protein